MSAIVARMRGRRSRGSAVRVTAPARFEDLCLDALDHQTLADRCCAGVG
jgi:hypothetical protein